MTIDLHSPNILHICIIILGMITLFCLLWLQTCSHVRFVSFDTNLSLLVKKKYISTFQFYPIFIQLITLGLLINFREYYLLFLIITGNFDFGNLIKFLLSFSKSVRCLLFFVLPIYKFLSQTLNLLGFYAYLYCNFGHFL